MGRTQLEDAVPMTLGQTFNGFASILRDEIRHLNEAAADFLIITLFPYPWVQEILGGLLKTGIG